MKKYLPFLFLVFAIKLNAQQQKQNFDWLVGNWQLQKDKATFIIESWKKINDSLYSGYSAVVKGKDTIPEEKIELKKENSKWLFIPTTLNQNNGKPVTFNIIFTKNKEFICENLQHDFPTRINYRWFNKNLLASIEGKRNNVFKKINYDYTKAKL